MNNQVISISIFLDTDNLWTADVEDVVNRRRWYQDRFKTHAGALEWVTSCIAGQFKAETQVEVTP
jgi:hypothetical protein